MDNRTHDLNMKELIESLNAAGIEAVRYGRSGVACSFSNGNYILRLSLTNYTPEIAKQFERGRLKYWAEKYKDWEKAALKRANEAELQAKRHHEDAQYLRKMLEQLD